MNMDRDREIDINFDFLRGVIMGAGRLHISFVECTDDCSICRKNQCGGRSERDENGMSKEAVEIKDKAEILSSYINRFYLNDIDYGKGRYYL